MTKDERDDLNKRIEPLPERLRTASPFERFAYRLGFSRCPDGRLHADWHRFRPETNPTRGPHDQG